MAEWTHIVDLVDIDRYPLHDPLLAAYAQLLHESTADYRSSGRCVLPGFFRPEAVAMLAAEAERLAPLSHRIPGRESCVAYDLVPLGAALRTFYEWTGLLRFVSGVTGELVLFRSSDPLGALVLSVMIDGDAVVPAATGPAIQVSVAIGAAALGGEVLAGTDVLSIDKPGSLVLWDNTRLARGVAKVQGRTPRYEARMLFSPAPGADSSDAEKLHRFGRLPGPSRRG